MDISAQLLFFIIWKSNYAKLYLKYPHEDNNQAIRHCLL